MRRALPVAAALALVAAGCSTQRVPGPMGRAPGFEPVGQGDDYVPGPAEVVVVCHADLVSIRRPGARAGFPMRFYDKRLRLGSGGWVLTGTGGRAELVWPGTTSSVILYEGGAALVGEPSRAEPILILDYATRARVLLAPGHHLALVGGTELEGDPALDSGPFEFEMVARDRIAVANHGRTLATLHFLDQQLVLGPNEALELPVLPGGSGPRAPVPGRYAVDGTGLPGPGAQALGEVEELPNAAGLEVRAAEAAEVSALGVTVELEPGQAAAFESLGAAPRP